MAVALAYLEIYDMHFMFVVRREEGKTLDKLAT